MRDVEVQRVMVQGRERNIVFFSDGIGFLNDPSDVYDTGIACGLTLKQWKNSQYLARITSRRFTVGQEGL